VLVVTALGNYFAIDHRLTSASFLSKQAAGY
jgi:hypothetical protein